MPKLIRRRDFRVFTWTVLFCLPFLGAGPSSYAQVPDSIQRAALADYHGPDLKGKDGPLAKAGLDLLLLYHEYRAQGQGEGASTPSRLDAARRMNVQGAYVAVDAIARTEASVLQSDLDSLGMKRSRTTGRIVSGLVPIPKIPDLASLETLRGVAPSRAETRTEADSTVPDQAPSPPLPPAPQTPVDTTGSPSDSMGCSQ